MSGRFSLQFLAAVAIVGWGAVVRTGMAAPTSQPAGNSVAQLIEEVQSADYATREAATQALMRLSPEHRREIEAALAGTANEEAITRLEKVAVHLFIKPQISMTGELGFLGVHMTGEVVQLDPKSSALQTCIVVWKTQPGFPSAEVLEPGDRIIGINGERFPDTMSTEAFKEKIQGAGGGNVVNFNLIRNGKMMDVEVRLAGLRAEDANPAAIAQIVDARDRAAAEYRVNLKTGRAGTVAAHRDLPPQSFYDGVEH